MRVGSGAKGCGVTLAPTHQHDEHQMLEFPGQPRSVGTEESKNPLHDLGR